MCGKVVLPASSSPKAYPITGFSSINNNCKGMVRFCFSEGHKEDSFTLFHNQLKQLTVALNHL